MQIEIDGVPALVAEARPFEPARPSLLWLHGAGMDRTVWTLVARDRRLEAWNSLAVDLPGHGGSAGSAPGSIVAAASFVRRLMDRLGIARAVLAGHSMGAAIALEVAAAEPARVGGLVLLGAAPALPVAPALLAAARDEPAQAAELMTRWAIGRRHHLAAPATPGVPLREAARRLILNARPGVLAADLGSCAGWAGVDPTTVPAPTLLLAGAEDRMTAPRQAAALAERLPQAALRVLPGCGHMLMLERPEPVLAAITPFLAALER